MMPPKTSWALALYLLTAAFVVPLAACGTKSQLQPIEDAGKDDAGDVPEPDSGKPDDFLPGRDAGGPVACPTATFIEPLAPSDGSDTLLLGGDGVCPVGEAFATRVVLSTNAGDDSSVELLVNGVRVASSTVNGASLTFDDLTLTESAVGKTLSVDFGSANGMPCVEDFPAKIIVDCTAPDCSITSPVAVAYSAVGANPTLYLNSSMRGANGFDIGVESSADVAGQSIALIVDGNAGAPQTAKAAKDGSATFDAVDLAEGAHTVQAKCTDAAGNSSLSDVAQWVVDLTPSDLAILLPTSAQMFGIGAGCDSGVTGAYGVNFAATADKLVGRSATLTVGAFTKTYAAPLTGASLTDCMPVAEGANTLKLDLVNDFTDEAVSEMVSFSVDTLSIATPSANQVVGVAGSCNTGMGGEVGVTVTAAADPIHNGRSVSLKAGSNRLVTTTVASSVIAACVPASQGANTLTVSVLDTSSAALATEAVNFSLVTIAPTTGIPITTVTLPVDGPTYRTDKITLAWTAPTQEFPGQLKSYALRCANTALDVAVGTQGEHDAWWTAADVMTLPVGLVPPTASAAVKFRIGETKNCELRGVDAIGGMTPLVDSKAVSYPFRSHVFQPTSTGQRMGNDVAPVGDVNGDGFNDLLVGGRGEAYLIFGSETGWTATNPDVVFVGATTRFGAIVAGLGDFNDDGMDDFAISDAGTTNNTLTNAGRVFVFYGRPLVATASDWPATVNVSATSCDADVCFDHDFGGSFFGFAMSSAGDFNGDGVADLAAGAPLYAGPTGATPLLGRQYVLLGQKFEASMTKALGQKFWQIAVAVPAASRGLYMEGDNVNVTALGNSVAPLGGFDGTAGDDLVVAAPSTVNAAGLAASKVFFLSGHPYVFATDTGMKLLGLSELGFRDVSGTPSGLPIDSGTKGYYGTVYSLGNVVDLAPGTAGMRDIGVKQGSTNEFLVYLGDNDFSTADKIRVQGDQTGKNPGTGNSVGSGFSPVLQSLELGDVDGDGFADVCAGETLSSTTGAAPGAAYLWYASVVSTKTSAGVLSYTEAASIAPSAVAGAGSRVVEFVGDLDDDGEPDMAIGDPSATTNNGALTILY